MVAKLKCMKCMKETLRKIFAGRSIEDDPQEVFPTVQDVEDTYVSRFESNTKVDSAPIIRGEEVDSEGFGAIAPEETERVFKKIDLNTAPGIDQKGTAEIKQADFTNIAAILNAWWEFGIPPEMKENRTILLAKGGDRAEVGNWRPITIDNLLTRLYAKVWDARLREVVKIDVRQKAFCPVDGCFDSVNIVKKS